MCWTHGSGRVHADYSATPRNTCGRSTPTGPRLNEIHVALGSTAGASAGQSGPGKLILPDGCKDLDSAADQFLAGLAPEDLLAFDQALQKDITRKFRGLGNVCLKPAEKGAAFRDLLLAKARAFLDARLDHSDPAAVFFRSRTQTGTAIRN